MKNRAAMITAIATHRRMRSVLPPDDEGPSAFELRSLYFVLSVILSFPKIMSDELSHISIEAVVNVIEHIFAGVGAAITCVLDDRIVPTNMDWRP